MELQFELIIFTLCVCLGAGMFALQGCLVLVGKGEKIQLPALLSALVVVGIGGICSFLHLQHWERIFNGFGHLTSGITQELIAIVVFFVALALYFVMLRRSETGTPPKWCAIMAIVISVLLVFVMAHSYNMASRPVWDTPLLWIYYLSNAAFFGALAIALIAAIKKDGGTSLAVKIATIAGIIQALATAIYAGFFTMTASAFTNVGYYFDPTHPTKAMIDPESVFAGIFTGEYALVFWLGVVVVGLIIPIVLTLFANKKEPKTISISAGVALICALAGGICFRVILYVLGISMFAFY